MMHAEKHIEDSTCFIKVVQLFDSIIFGILYSIMSIVVCSTVFITLACVRIACVFGLHCKPSSDSNRKKSE
jgi:hypothetical protein